jgi:hypothetical protein
MAEKSKNSEKSQLRPDPMPVYIGDGASGIADSYGSCLLPSGAYQLPSQSSLRDGRGLEGQVLG